MEDRIARDILHTNVQKSVVRWSVILFYTGKLIQYLTNFICCGDLLLFSARCNIYIRTYATMSLSVCLSVCLWWKCTGAL